MALTIVAMSDLAGATRRQHEADFERLVQAEARRLYRLALAIVDEPHEAEDAVQDTMVIAWRRWSSLEGFANQSAWLTRVCVRECLRRRRSFRRRQPWFWGREPLESEAFIADLGVRLMDVHRAYQHLSTETASDGDAASPRRIHGGAMRCVSGVQSRNGAKPPWTSDGQATQGARR